MNKLVLKDISIIDKNKEKINGLKLENKDLKFILYSYDGINVPDETEIFKKFSFEEEINITTKKTLLQSNSVFMYLLKANYFLHKTLSFCFFDTSSNSKFINVFNS